MNVLHFIWRHTVRSGDLSLKGLVWSIKASLQIFRPVPILVPVTSKRWKRRTIRKIQVNVEKDLRGIRL